VTVPIWERNLAGKPRDLERKGGLAERGSCTAAETGEGEVENFPLWSFLANSALRTCDRDFRSLSAGLPCAHRRLAAREAPSPFAESKSNKPSPPSKGLAYSEKDPIPMCLKFPLHSTNVGTFKENPGSR
jgi:hypothetical protein